MYYTLSTIKRDVRRTPESRPSFKPRLTISRHVRLESLTYGDANSLHALSSALLEECFDCVGCLTGLRLQQ